MTITPCCEKCRHWYATDENSLGRCRRYPPQCIPTSDGGYDSIFPETYYSACCGEFSFNHESLMEFVKKETPTER